MKSNSYHKRSTVLFALSIILCVYADPFSNAVPRMFISPEMCTPKQRSVYDCSFQFPLAPTNSCQIYSTGVCKSNGFPSWNLEPLSRPMKESNSEFTVTMLPYSLYIDDLHKENPVSAVQILLTSFNKNINGYSIIMTEDIHGRNICRIIDFRNSLNNFDIPFKFSYDCFNNLVEDKWKKASITFRAYPLNNELSYFAYFPLSPNTTSPCDWTPLVMIYQESLAENYIQLKFSNAPKDLNIVFFIVTLFNLSDEEVDSIKIPSNVKNDMIATKFMLVEGGLYSINISIILAKNSCTIFKSNFFLVGPEIKDYSLLTFIILLVIMIISASGLLYFSCQWYLKTVVSRTKPTLLLVYYHTYPHHEFLVMYAEYLENHYGVKVNTIYKKTGNPKAYLEDGFSELNPQKYLLDVFEKSDIIVFVISEGMFESLKPKNHSVKGEHYWVKQLPDAEALTYKSLFGRKHFCKISFPYSGKQHVPKELECKGPLFMLPDDIDDFLCFVFSCSSKLTTLSKLCCVKHHRILGSNCLQKDHEKLKQKLQSLIENRSDYVPFLAKHVDEGNPHNEWIKESDSCSNDNEKNSRKVNNILGKMSDVLPPDSSKNVDQKVSESECRNQPDIADEKSSFIAVDDPPDECKVENLELQEKDLMFFRYCVGKMVNFER